MTSDKKLERDGVLESPWQVNIKPPEADLDLSPEQAYEVLIVGAGITGITAGLLLQQDGKKVAIAEAHRIGFGTTGGTSAHINTFADTTYSEARNAFGNEGAQLFADAVTGGLELIRDHVIQLAIPCNFEVKPGFVYAETEEEVKQLDDMYISAREVGIEVSYTSDVPTNVAFLKAVRFENQAQFHPTHYVTALADKFRRLGGVILENTKIESVSSANGLHTCKHDGGVITAPHVIYATHLPPGINVFNFRCAPYRSYVLGVKLKSDQYPDALIYDMQEPYHYIRTQELEGGRVLLIGGDDHKTGHGSPKEAFASLEKYARKYYDVSAITHRWSSQYYVPVDGLPYIGQMPFEANGVYCATGFNGNGMMLGSISGKVLADIILKKENPLIKLFNPARLKPMDGFTEFVKENADVVYHFVADRLTVTETDSLKRIRPGVGKVVEFEGEKLAVYRDDTGEFHILSPVCTHAACIVSWNPEEISWDCPCHGARYDIEGNVLTGPAVKGLSKMQ